MRRNFLHSASAGLRAVMWLPCIKASTARLLQLASTNSISNLRLALSVTGVYVAELEHQRLVVMVWHHDNAPRHCGTLDEGRLHSYIAFQSSRPYRCHPSHHTHPKIVATSIHTATRRRRTYPLSHQPSGHVRDEVPLLTKLHGCRLKHQLLKLANLLHHHH